MRRKDRQITDVNEIAEILKRADVLRVAFNDGKYPYILPVNFGFDMEAGKLTLYFHGAKEGYKHAVIANDPHVAFETDNMHALLLPVGEASCTASFAYESVIGQGVIEKVSGDEKDALLTAILAHYDIEKKQWNPGHYENTVVYKITAESYTAKRRATER